MATNSINLNPFAVVVAGVFVLILIALYVARRRVRQGVSPMTGTMGGMGYGARGYGIRWMEERQEEVVPELMDVYVEKGVLAEEGNGDGMWRDVMPLSVRYVPLPKAPSAPPRTRTVLKGRVVEEGAGLESEAAGTMEVTVAIGLPDWHGKLEGNEYQYALGITRVACRSYTPST